MAREDDALLSCNGVALLLQRFGAALQNLGAFLAHTMWERWSAKPETVRGTAPSSTRIKMGG